MIQKMPSGERHTGFTRILHRTVPDILMEEVGGTHTHTHTHTNRQHSCTARSTSLGGERYLVCTVHLHVLHVVCVLRPADPDILDVPT